MGPQYRDLALSHTSVTPCIDEIRVFQINKKPDLRTRLQLLVATGVPDLSTSVVDENNININSAEESASGSFPV